ncbi:MAG: hypothetical protein SF162_03395 [bacterium]|nr:hypothetical protein [bacterium]
MKRNVRSLSLAFVFAVSTSLPALAQDSGSTGTRVNCDSTLVLLAGLAQRYFGFTSMSGMDMSGLEYGQYGAFWNTPNQQTPQSTIGGAGTGNTAGDAAGSTGSADTSNTTGGTTGDAPQAQATADASGSTDGTTGSTGDAMQAQATADASGSTGGTTGSTDTGTTGTTPSVYLNPPAIADEDPTCLQLRAELESFFTTELATGDWDQRFRGGMSGTNMADTSTSATSTQEAGG